VKDERDTKHPSGFHGPFIEKACVVACILVKNLLASVCQAKIQSPSAVAGAGDFEPAFAESADFHYRSVTFGLDFCAGSGLAQLPSPAQVYKLM